MSPATVAGRSGPPEPDGSEGAGPPGPPGPADLDRRAREVLEANWRAPGFCVPNPASYPWQWLWDSCFHAVVWLHLGEAERAVTELTNALSHQAVDGFVPHMTYWSGRGQADDATHESFWGRTATSSITQPPMYGHAVAELHRAGVDVPEELVERCRRGLGFLFERSRGRLGPVIVHPWESGCDDSPRWDAWSGPDEAWSPRRARVLKGELVGGLQFADTGSPVASTAFEVAAAGFGALVAFNARELATVTGDDALADGADAIAASLDERWEPEVAGWADAVLVGPELGPVPSRPVRTVEALLPVLVSADEATVGAALEELIDPGAFGGPFGPCGVHRAEPSFDPGTYWRGASWPQLTYLLWVAARRAGHSVAPVLRDQLRTGAWRSGFAEYWDPDTGAAGGASPQSWTTLAAVVD